MNFYKDFEETTKKIFEAINDNLFSLIRKTVDDTELSKVDKIYHIEKLLKNKRINNLLEFIPDIELDE